MKRIDVALVDNNCLMRSFLREKLLKDPLLTLIFESSSGQEFIQKGRSISADILLVSSHIHDIVFTLFLKEVKKLSRKTMIICLDYNSGFDFSQPEVQPLITGVFSTRSTSPKQLIRNLYRLSNVSRKTLERLELHESAHRYGSGENSWKDVLSDRELAVLRFYGEGFSEKEIGECLGIVDKTVEKHKSTIKQKLNARNPLAALTFALRNGIIE